MKTNNKLNTKFTKELEYFYGLLWADGHVTKPGNKHKKIDFYTTIKDLKDFKKILTLVYNWSIYKRKTNKDNPQWLESYVFSFNNAIIHKHFIEMDYHLKSHINPTKILNYIPEKFHKYWFRGYIDGDGCFYCNPKQCLRQFALSSTYEQNWKFMFDLCDRLSIKNGKVQKRQLVKSAYSSFRICNKEGIQKLCDYIYGDKWDGIGLKRKYNKYLECINMISQQNKKHGQYRKKKS